MPTDAKKPAFPPAPEGPGSSVLRQLLRENVDADSGSGALRVLQQRVLILRPEALADLQKHLEDTIGLSSKGFLYLAGEKSAQEGHDMLAASPASRAADPAPLDILAERLAAMSLLGWGRLRVTVEDAAAHRHLVSLENSPIAEAYGDSKKPVCHLLAGWIAGTAERVLGESLLCEEIACRSQGKPRCEFRLRPTPYG